MRAAAVVVAALDDAAAAGTEDAGPRRDQPGEVDPVEPVGVLRVDELHPLARKIKVNLWHGVEPSRATVEE